VTYRRVIKKKLIFPEQHKLVGQRLTNGWPTLDNGRPTNLCCSGCLFSQKLLRFENKEEIW